MYNNIKKLLKELNQEELLTYYNELNDTKKEKLLNDIKSINIELMNKLYKNSYIEDNIDTSLFSPLPIINTGKRKNNILAAEKIVKNNQYGVLIMAGGSASRLGLNLPKGCLKFNIKNKEISIFELYINQFKNIQKNYGVTPYLYIMLNDAYYATVIHFFKENQYFNYPKNCIKFFKQNKLPILSIDGKILLKNKYTILKGPNGNGDVFNSLKQTGLIEDMKYKNLKYVLFTTIDNIKTNLFDLDFIGSVINGNYQIGSKTIMKKSELEKDWIFCKYNNHPSMMKSKYITPSISNYKINNNYVYREKNITYHLISFDSIKKYANKELEYHRAYKPNSYLNLNNEYITSESNNSFKFEKFIFDAFKYDDNMLLYRTTNKEFLAIKTIKDLKKAQEYFNKVCK